MFKFKDNAKAAGNIFTASGAVTAIVAVVFFASTAWLAAIAAALIVIGCGLSLYSNAEFEKDATQKHASQSTQEKNANVAAETAVDCCTATTAVQQHQPQARVAA